MNRTQQNSRRCQQALRRYGTDDTLKGCLIDLLSDAMHWCRAKGRGFNAALASAQAHFDAETSEE